MSLRKKLFLYSLGIAGIVGALMISYICFLLPSMYLDYSNKKDVNAVKSSLLSFAKDGNTDSFHSGQNSIMGIIVPKEGYKIHIENVYFKGDFEIPDGNLRTAFDTIRKLPRKFSSKEAIKEKDFELVFSQQAKLLKDSFQKEYETRQMPSLLEHWNFSFISKENSINYEDGSRHFYPLSKSAGLMASTVKDKHTQTRYTNYIGFSNKKDAYYIVFATVVTPNINDILPVILSALPLLLAMVILLGLIISELLAKAIVNPIHSLAKDADKRRYNIHNQEIAPILHHRKDEIGSLTDALNLLYEKQSQHYRQLEEDGKRRDVFMKASSHQLKTPLAAATLLLEGMISKTGKYADHETYLPKLQKQLFIMKKMIDDILQINRMAENIELESVSVDKLIKTLLGRYQIQADANDLLLSQSGSALWQTDGEILYQILDNLINNAVLYTSKGGKIDISIDRDFIEVKNAPASISTELLPAIFEPFVSGSNSSDGHGLGLYVAKYFSQLLDFDIFVKSDYGQVFFRIERRNL